MLDLFHNGNMLFADKEAQVINFLSAHDAFKSYIFAHFSKKKNAFFVQCRRKINNQTSILHPVSGTFRRGGTQHCPTVKIYYVYTALK